MPTLLVAIMTASCRSTTHWPSTASASSALVSPVPSPKRPCHAGKCALIRENQIPLTPAFHATSSPPSLAPAPPWPSPRPLCHRRGSARSCIVDLLRTCPCFATGFNMYWNKTLYHCWICASCSTHISMGHESELHMERVIKLT
jgi:hypothetical protein